MVVRIEAIISWIKMRSTRNLSSEKHNEEITRPNQYRLGRIATDYQLCSVVTDEVVIDCNIHRDPVSNPQKRRGRSLR